MEISESNRLIADFLGGHYSQDHDIDARYHDDWNWLYKVIAKCKGELTEITEENKNKWGDMAYDSIQNTLINISGIDETYDAVLVFITLYNHNRYPFTEGDDYWTIEHNLVIWSCWDDISEELHTPYSTYYKTKEDAVFAHYKANHTQDEVGLMQYNSPQAYRELKRSLTNKTN